MHCLHGLHEQFVKDLPIVPEYFIKTKVYCDLRQKFKSMLEKRERVSPRDKQEKKSSVSKDLKE